MLFQKTEFQRHNRVNNHDFNIDQNNCDYDFFHNRAALTYMYRSVPCLVKMLNCSV